MFKLTLACDHEVVTDIELRHQYPDDEHYVFCPSCRALKDDPRYKHVNLVICWTKVMEVEHLSDVHKPYALIMPNDILRLQPSVPRNRVRPFPYIRGFQADGRIRRSDRGRARK